MCQSHVFLLPSYSLLLVLVQSTKVSVLPALLNHLESSLCDAIVPPANHVTPLHCDMAYVDPNSLFR